MNIIDRIIKKKEYKSLYDLKEEQKEAAVSLKKAKAALKEMYRARQTAWAQDSKVYKMKFEFRHKHIAYCLLRGTDLEKIEQPAEDNQPSSKRIGEIMEEYKNEKDVCNCEE